MMKRNPGVSEEIVLKMIRKFTVKRNFVMLFSVFLFLGIMISYSYPDHESLKLSLTIFLFLSSLFMTSVSLQQATATGVFDPLRILPIPKIEKKISILFLIDSFSVIGIIIPLTILLAFNDNLKALTYFLWAMFTIFFGHTLGMVFLALFGVTTGKRSIIGSKTLFIVFILLIVLLMIPEILGLGIIAEIREISGRYCYVYPFTVLCEPMASVLLLIIYSLILIPINERASKKGIESIFNSTLEKGSKKIFRASSGGKILTLVLKDLKIVSRNLSGLLGILIPFLVITPQVFVVGSMLGGDVIVLQTISAVSLLSPIILGLLTRGEGREIDFLRTLPLSKKDFILEKVMATSLITCSGSLALTIIACFLGATPMALPVSVVLPMSVSLLSALYLFNYPSDEVGIPNMGVQRMVILFLASIFLLAFLITPIYIFPKVSGFALTFILSSFIVVFMFLKVRI